MPPLNENNHVFMKVDAWADVVKENAARFSTRPTDGPDSLAGK
jgi:hypothetical protein